MVKLRFKSDSLVLELALKTCAEVLIREDDRDTFSERKESKNLGKWSNRLIKCDYLSIPIANSASQPRRRVFASALRSPLWEECWQFGFSLESWPRDKALWPLLSSQNCCPPAWSPWIQRRLGIYSRHRWMAIQSHSLSHSLSTFD